MLDLDRIVGVLAPHSCLVCGNEGALICLWCRTEVMEPLPPRCYRCHAQTDDFATCRKCRPVTRLSNVWVTTKYHSLPKQLIQKLKFERVKAAAAMTAELMSETLPYLPPDTVITYVPTATSRRRQRGYDQAELIARSLSQKTGLGFIKALARQGQSRQVGSTRKQRQAQLIGAFRPLNTSKITSAKLLIVDDVVTTGATLEAAATALRQAGAKKLYGAVFAQKI